MTKKERKVERISFHLIAIAILVTSLILSAFRFRPVFWRVVQSIEDLFRSICFYFTEWKTPGRIHATVNEIPPGMKSYLPIEWGAFKAQAQLFGKTIFTKENLQLYLILVGSYVEVCVEWIQHLRMEKKGHYH